MTNGSPASDRLYHLLPAVYRETDAAEGYPLRALLRLVTAQADRLEADIQQLWDNYFIETCDRWVIPYIGDLVSNHLLYDAERTDSDETARTLFPDLVGPELQPELAIRTRADVAKTIYYRRRKGTLPMLEELSRDVTGWAAHAVEFFERLNWTQNLNHIRFHSLDCPDLRRVEPLDRLEGAFDTASHTVDVRAIRQQEGWYNLRNIGFFLWRLRSYPLRNVPARQASAPWRYHFSPLGNPAPLFSRWQREGDEAGLATEWHVPGPIRAAFFYEDLVSYRQQSPPRPDFTRLYGAFDLIAGSGMQANPTASCFILRNGLPIAPAINPTAAAADLEPQIVCRRLDPWPATPPTGRVIAVDVERGRLAIGDGWSDATEQVDVFFHYGFSADLGGGTYERGQWLVRPELATTQLRVKADGSVPVGAPPVTHTTLIDALNDWASAPEPRANTIITILDSRSYALPAQLELSNEHWLAIEAVNGERPVLQTAPTGLEIQVSPPAQPNDPTRAAALTLSGVVVEGHLEVTGDLGRFRLLHSTLVPGRGLTETGDPATAAPSLIVQGTVVTPDGLDVINAKLEVQIAFSITGGLQIPEHAQALWLLDSIVDGVGGTAIIATDTADQPAPPTQLERTTILGASFVKQLLASEVIFSEPTIAARQQEGCVRFSYVPPGSVTPRRYRCQPDLEIQTQLEQAEQQVRPTLTDSEWNQLKAQIRLEIHQGLVPSFTAIHYGRPGYAQLRLSSQSQIRTGAADGSEMGAFSHLKQPQRETNLRIRLEEYLPFGLDAGLIDVT